MTENINERLRAVRLARGWTQLQVAEQVGKAAGCLLSNTHISRWERGLGPDRRYRAVIEWWIAANEIKTP